MMLDLFYNQSGKSIARIGLAVGLFVAPELMSFPLPAEVTTPVDGRGGTGVR
jgi:hypothetical protein